MSETVAFISYVDAEINKLKEIIAALEQRVKALEDQQQS